MPHLFRLCLLVSINSAPFFKAVGWFRRCQLWWKQLSVDQQEAQKDTDATLSVRDVAGTLPVHAPVKEPNQHVRFLGERECQRCVTTAGPGGTLSARSESPYNRGNKRTGHGPARSWQLPLISPSFLRIR
ncbi:hypothetical protein OG21DRAFT_1172703 [Imleria badia]|nr:hypothetical protein OG21DRAFT_1172703 [Imleria badia]